MSLINPRASFHIEAACPRLINAVRMEISDEWEAGKVYLTLARAGSSS